MIRLSIAVIGLVMTALWSVPSWGDSRPTDGPVLRQEAYYFDPSGAEDIETIDRVNFVAGALYINQGLSPGSIWFKYTVVQPKGQETHLVFDLANLDSVEMYRQLNKDSKQFERIQISREQINTQYTWMSDEEEQVLYLKINNQPVLKATPHIFNTTELTAFLKTKNSAASIAMTMQMIVFFSCLIFIYINPQSIFNLFILALSLTRLSLLMFLNYPQALVWIDLPLLKQISYALFFIDKIILYFFSINLLKYKFKFNFNHHVAVLILSGLSLIGLALIAMDLRAFMTFASVTISLFVVIIFYLTCQEIVREQTWRKEKIFYLVLIFFILMGYVVLLSDITGLRWAPNSTNHFLQIRLLMNLMGIFAMFLFQVVETLRFIKTKNAELIHLFEQLQTEELLRKNQQNFMSMLLHELNTPLATIKIGLHTILRRGSFSDEEKERGQRIDKSLESINQIIESCVMVDKYTSSVSPVQLRPTGVAELVEDLMDEAIDRTPAAADRIELIHNAELAVGQQMMTDIDMLKVVCSNLLNNALKYSPLNTTIQFKTEQDLATSSITFEVSNELLPKQAPDERRLFQRYYRAESSKKIPGTGLGLWLSQTLAQQLGSEIHVKLSHHHISFSLTLPLSNPSR